MKAAIVTAPEKVEVVELPSPRPEPYQVLCRTLYGSICAGTDWHILRREPPFGQRVQLPAMIGHESIGEVVELGEKVRHLRIGDRVTRVGCPAMEGVSSWWGGFAEYGVAWDYRAMREDGIDRPDWPILERNRILPSHFDPAAATMFITWRETLSYARRIGMSPGRNVLVIGSGGNGLAFVKHFRLLGAERVVMIGAPHRKEVALALGADAFHDYRATNLSEMIQSETADGFDIALDVIGTSLCANLALAQLKDQGILGIYGLDASGTISLKPNETRGTFTVYRGGYHEGEVHDLVCQWVEDGKLDANSWLDLKHPLPLERIQEGF